MVDPDVTYVMMEVRSETDYVVHHAQKVIAIFAAMRRFADLLRQRGHTVRYLRIGDADNTQDILKNLDYVTHEVGASHTTGTNRSYDGTLSYRSH
jgi:deoxyribodipyrimidine photolyase-related protein